MEEGAVDISDIILAPRCLHGAPLVRRCGRLPLSVVYYGVLDEFRIGAHPVDERFPALPVHLALVFQRLFQQSHKGDPSSSLSTFT